ncbi:hypothetical protein [Streptomyces sp. BE133]|uniref:hypothetical protein n=1 Tax=Streptomyces sp. BE133 TaxID=3002523 RepID=UPI002E76D71C|nr:hypothetical protein [Streptomyces sp. BE133]MEE1805851.1 hypothetical protein [Streptomyces sp. BE133]
MSEGEQLTEPSGASLTAVIAVLTPILFGVGAVIFLGSGYGLKLLVAEPAFAGTLVTLGWVSCAGTALSILVSAAGLLVTALRNAASLEDRQSETAACSDCPRTGAVDRTLGFAAFVAGARRAHLHAEWAALLAGDPENGIVLSASRRMRYALGCLWAAARMRAHDLVGPLWLPVDWLLSNESRTNRFIAIAVGGQAVYVVGSGGIPALVTEIWEPCALFGGGLYILARWLRRIRGIELAAARGDSSEE